MRIKEVADLAGTTVRTIRHYHRLGLLAVPETVGGRRDYDLGHLARLMRIRWLARSGLNLAKIAQMLEADPDGTTVLDDLRQTARGIEKQMDELAAQHLRIEGMIAAVERDGILSPLPGSIERFYDRLEEIAGDADEVLDIVRKERKMLLVPAYHDLLPASLELLLERFAPPVRERLLKTMASLQELTHLSAAEAADAIPSLARETFEIVNEYEPAILALLEEIAESGRADTLLSLLSRLSAIGYPHPNHRLYVDEFLELAFTHPHFGPALRKLDADALAFPPTPTRQTPPPHDEPAADTDKEHS